jgi:HTH-type transcriptional regulator / antitoxin HigA
MTNKLQNEFYPDYTVSPGETLLETLETISMSQTELARRMGSPVNLVNEIIQGKAALTPEIARQLEQALHIPASFWLNMERHYREFLARPVKEQHLTEWVE